MTNITTMALGAGLFVLGLGFFIWTFRNRRQFNCPRCGKLINIREWNESKMKKCPFCKKVIHP